MRHQGGFSIFAMIITIAAVVAALTAALTLSSRTNESAMSSLRNSQLIVAQANLIRSKLINCALDNPGNNGGSNHLPYPRSDAWGAVSGLTCPGSGLSLWTGTDAVFAPTAPPGFQAWQYINDATSVRVRVATTGTDAAVALAAAKFGAAETADSTSTTFVLTITK